MLEITTAADDVEVERVPMFSLNGKVYTVPKDVDGSLAIAYLDDVAQLGTAVAEAKLFREVLGAGALAALRKAKGIRPEQVKQLMEELTTYVMGAVENTGN